MVNYFDGEKYVEVDASYKEESNEYSQDINKYSVKLPKKIHENKKIKLSFNNSSSIEITYNNISKVSGVVLENNNQSDKINELKNLSGSVIYNNIFDNVDLKIDSSGTKFKENIILNKYITDFSFSYNIKLKGLRLIYEEDNIIFKNEEGLIVYEISPYFMYDSNNNYSSDLEIKLEQLKENEYKFTVTPSNEYLSTATYPVTIDPVISYYANSTSSSSIKIKTIQKGFTTCSVNSYLQLTKYIHTMGDLIEDIGYYGIMEVNLTNLPPLDNIDYAFIRLKGSSEFYSEKAVVRRITSHSYNSINGTTNYSTVSPVVKVENSGKKSYSIDFIDYYNFNKNTTCVYEISPENFTSNDTTQVYGNHLSATDNVPVLNIVSYDYDGLSSDRTYESVSAGDAGVVNIDNALGSSNLSIPVYSNNYVNLTHYYSQFSLNDDMFGNKINVSLYEKLTNITDTSLCYVNGTGYREYFYYDEETSTYKSEDGNSSKIEFKNSKYYYSLDSIQKEFSQNGILIKTILNYDNPDERLKKEINYLTTNNGVLYTVSTNDTNIIFNYKNINSKQLLDYVIVQRLIDGVLKDYIKIVYSYDSNYNLINIRKYLGDITKMENELLENNNDLTLTESERINGEKGILLKYLQYQNYYEYDDNNRLTKVYTSKNIISYSENTAAYSGIAISYSNNKVSKYSYKTNDFEELKDVMTFSYGNNQTIVTDYTGYSRTYLFDYFNHTINVQDSNGYVTAYTYANFASEVSNVSPKYYLKNQITHVSNPINVSVSPLLNGGFENVTENGTVCLWNETPTTKLSTSNLTQDSAYGTFAIKLGQPSNSTVSSCYQKIYLPAGSYTLSSIVKIATRRTNNSLIGYIKIEGEMEYSVQSEELTFTNKTYEYVSTSFIVNSPTYVTITCGVRLTNGMLLLNTDASYFDNIAIGNGNIYTNYNLLENSSFEINKAIIGDETVDTRWDLTSAQISERYQTNKQFGISELLLRYKGKAKQTLSYNTQPGDLFNLSSFARYNNSSGNVKVKVRFYDSTSSYTTDYYTLQFANGPKIEQFAIGNIEVGIPNNLEDDINIEELDIQYNRIEVLIINESLIDAYVDNVTLISITNGKNYEYNDNNKVTQIKEGNQTTNITYSADGHTINSIQTNNISLEINKVYDEEFSVNEYVTTSLEEIENNTTTLKTINFTKDQDNNKIYTSYIDKDGYGYTTSAVYDELYQYQLSYTDEFGNTTNYEYDYYTGNLVKSKTNYRNYYSNEDTFLNLIYGYDKHGNIDYFKISNTKLNPNFNENEEESIVNQKEIELLSQSLTYEYDERGNLIKIRVNSSNTRVYEFEYDQFNFLTKVKLNGIIIKEYNYLTTNDINTGIIEKEINQDGSYYKYTYDENFNLTSYSFVNGSTSTLYATYKYDEFSKIIYYKDELVNTTYYYDYDKNGFLIKIKMINSNSNKVDYISIEYDDENRINKITKCFNEVLQTTEYNYKNNQVTSLKINDSVFVNPKEIFEEISGNTEKILQSFVNHSKNNNDITIIEEKDYYLKSDEFMNLNNDNNLSLSNNSISTRISKQEFIINGVTYTYIYTYDNLGNITCIETKNSESSEVIKYSYNYYFGQLVNEIVEKNNVLIYNCIYTYDSYGNVIEINRPVRLDIYSNYPQYQFFEYDNDNQLRIYKIDGVTYQVDYNNGNPNKFKDFNLTFNNGNLTSLTNNNNNISYEYNAEGIRIKKVVNGVTTTYTVFNGLIMEETIEGTAGYTIRYLYDDNNLLLGFIYNNTTYYYQRTLTGDISRIVDEAGEIKGEYIYDSFGNILNLDALTEIAEINPFRYKGYYYDQETNLYYCKSRYYSPEIYRWLSRDAIEYLDTSSITGCNLYVYCNNNPIMYVDENGCFSLSVFMTKLITTVSATVIALIAQTAVEIKIAEIIYSNNTMDYNLTDEDVIIDNYKIFIYEDIQIGKYNDHGEYEIFDSYRYNRTDMMIICKKIANHMGDSTAYQRLYNEWEAHNYGYYAFGNNGLCGLANFIYGINKENDLIDSCHSVNFGINKETGGRGFVLSYLKFFGNIPIFPNPIIPMPFKRYC